MMARAAGHDNAPTIDHLFDPAKGADWHGVGWQNPVADKVTFATGPQASEPSATTALPLDGTTDLGALLGHAPVVLACTVGAPWLNASGRSLGSIVTTQTHAARSRQPALLSADKTVPSTPTFPHTARP